jgi:hypothetical protein
MTRTKTPDAQSRAPSRAAEAHAPSQLSLDELSAVIGGAGSLANIGAAVRNRHELGVLGQVVGAAPGAFGSAVPGGAVGGLEGFVVLGQVGAGAAGHDLSAYGGVTAPPHETPISDVKQASGSDHEVKHPAAGDNDVKHASGSDHEVKHPAAGDNDVKHASGDDDRAILVKHASSGDDVGKAVRQAASEVGKAARK